MKPKDWFSVGLRLFGVWWLLQCVQYLWTFAEVEFRLVSPERTAPAAYAVHAIIYLIGGLYLLMGAPLLMTFSGLNDREGRCTSCGCDLTGDTSGKCPECGKEV